MKRRILWLAALVLMTMPLAAQDRDRDRVQDQDRTKLVAVKGEMLQLRERAEQRLQEKQTLNDGTILAPDGSYVTPDGQRYKLKNGESLDGDGALYRNEYQYRHKMMRENEGLSQEQVRERNQNRWQYTLVEGNVYQVRTEAQMRLNDPMELANGVTAYPDGTYQVQNQERLRLKDGECLDGSGELFRNMYQMRKRMLHQKQMPAKKMLKKGAPKPNVNAGKKGS
jgi:hypothetical protein